MATASTIRSVSVTDAGLEVQLDLGRVLVTWSAAGVLRLRVRLPERPGPAGFNPPLETAFVPMDPEVVDLWRDSIRRAANPLVVPLGERYTLRISQQPLELALLCGGRVVWASLAGRSIRVDALGRRWLYSTRDDAHLFYGLGEKTGPLVRNARSLALKNVDAAGFDPRTGDPLYKHVPFYLVHQPGGPAGGHQTQTLGVYLNNAWPARFDFGAERSGYWPAYSSICVDGGDLDLFLLTGPTPARVLAQFHVVTGFPALPTKASLGYLGSTMFYTELPEGCDRAVLGFAERCAQEDIPLSGFHLSSGYTKGPDGLRYSLTWNQRGFPDPAGFVTEFQRAGLVLSPNVKPGLLTTHPLWEQFDQAGAFIRAADGSSLTETFWGGQASLVDFSNPVARALWRRHLVAELVDLGVTSIWNDNNEFELDDDLAVCDNDGNPVAANSLRPWLSNLMAREAWEAVREHGSARPFILSRAGFAGLAKYAQTWSGDNTSDWPNFHYNVATMLGMSLSGMPFTGMDIGGFTGPAPEPELFSRWVQNGVFHPRVCIHSVNSDNTVTEPWLYPELTATIRAAIRARYALLPTIYSAAAAAHEQGLPVVRPLVFEFPDFPPGFDRHTEFLLGPALLVVAVTQPGLRELAVCFPPGEWTCYYTGTRYPGGGLLTVPLAEDHSPLYYRTGHGFLLDGRFTASAAPQLVARLAMRADGSAEFYDDDGITRANEDGVSLHTSFRWSLSGSTITLQHRAAGPFVPGWTGLDLELDIGPIGPTQVSWQRRGEPAVTIPRAPRQPEADPGSWHYQPGVQRLRLALPAAAIVSDWDLRITLGQAMSISLEPGQSLPES